MGHSLVLLLAAGCTPDVGTVSGKVTYQGKPIPVGNVTFYAADNRVVFMPIQEDGSYHGNRVPVGKVAVTVETPDVEPFVLRPGEPPPPPGFLPPAYRLPNVKIPPRYTDRQTSGLETEVRPGLQTYDIDLTGPDGRPASRPATPTAGN